ncbi:MAG: hypothetical protein ACLPSW_35785 [Roseiarcus sp.]
MKILAITRRTADTSPERIAALQVPEASAVWDHMRRGLVREIYFDKERPAAILVLEAESIEAAREKLSQLPMVRERQIDFDFWTLGPFVQLAHLFAPEHKAP